MYTNVLCIHEYIFIHVYMCVYRYAYIYVCMYVYICVCMCIIPLPSGALPNTQDNNGSCGALACEASSQQLRAGPLTNRQQNSSWQRSGIYQGLRFELTPLVYTTWAWTSSAFRCQLEPRRRLQFKDIRRAAAATVCPLPFPKGPSTRISWLTRSQMQLLY